MFAGSLLVGHKVCETWGYIWLGAHGESVDGADNLLVHGLSTCEVWVICWWRRDGVNGHTGEVGSHVGNWVHCVDVKVVGGIINKC